MPKHNDGGPSAIWDKEATNIFCNICVQEIEIGNRPTTFFNKDGWENIANRFKELTGREYDRLKFKNKWDQLKKEWKAWKELKRGYTGLGWDPIKRTIQASDEWWAEKIKEQPVVKKYRQCGIEPEFEEKLDIMFLDVVATGHLSINPSSATSARVADEFLSDPLVHEEAMPSINQNEMDTSSSSKRPRIARKMKDNDDVIATSIDRLVAAFSAPVDYSYEKCVKILDEMPEVVSDNIFYGKCISKLEEQARRHLFLSLRPERRIDYLRVLADN